MSELNKELLEAISIKGSWMENDFLGKNNYPESKHDFAEINIRIATNECERICLQAQIDLLRNFYYGEDLKDDEILDFYKRVLQTTKDTISEQLKQPNQ